MLDDPLEVECVKIGRKVTGWQVGSIVAGGVAGAGGLATIVESALIESPQGATVASGVTSLSTGGLATVFTFMATKHAEAYGEKQCARVVNEIAKPDSADLEGDDGGRTLVLAPQEPWAYEYECSGSWRLSGSLAEMTKKTSLALLVEDATSTEGPEQALDSRARTNCYNYLCWYAGISQETPQDAIKNMQDNDDRADKAQGSP